MAKIVDLQYPSKVALNSDFKITLTIERESSSDLRADVKVYLGGYLIKEDTVYMYQSRRTVSYIFTARKTGTWGLLVEVDNDLEHGQIVIVRADADIEDIKCEPDTISKGSQSTVYITIKNTGEVREKIIYELTYENEAKRYQATLSVGERKTYYTTISPSDTTNVCAEIKEVIPL